MAGDPRAALASSCEGGDSTRRYTRSAVVRIRAAIAAAKDQPSGTLAETGQQDLATSAGPPPLTEATQRYSAEVRARLRAERLDAVAGRTGPDRSAARFRLGEHQPRRMVPAPSIVLPVARPGEATVVAASPAPPPRSVAARSCDLVGQEAGALLLLTSDGALHVIDAAQVCAVAVALVGETAPLLLVDVVLDWGSWHHPASILRLQPTAPSLGRIYPGQSLAEAVGSAGRVLAGSGAATLPAGAAFPGPPWPRFTDAAAFERAWLALAPREVAP